MTIVLAFAKHRQWIVVDGEDRVNCFPTEYVESSAFRRLKGEATPVGRFSCHIELLLKGGIIFRQQGQVISKG